MKLLAKPAVSGSGTRSRVAVWSVTAIVDFSHSGCHPRVMARAIFGFSHPDCEVEALVLLRGFLYSRSATAAVSGEAKLCRKCRSRFWAARARRVSTLIYQAFLYHCYLTEGRHACRIA